MVCDVEVAMRERSFTNRPVRNPWGFEPRYQLGGSR
jgi:hypothetical protein